MQDPPESTASTSSTSPPSLGDQLIELGWSSSANQRRLVRLAAKFADSDEWALAGYSSPGRWIGRQLDIAVRTANEWIQVGRALADLPVIGKALDDRLISFSKAKVLVRTATPETEVELLDLGLRHTAADLPAALARWSSEHEDDEVIDQRQHASQSLTWHTQPDGMVTVNARFAPGEAAKILSVIDAATTRRSQRPQPVAGEWPSLARQRAEALIDVVTGGGGGVIAEVVYHVRGDGCTLDNGTPISESAVARLLPDSFIRALIHDAEGRPIDASGRHRHPTDRQQRVVKDRDRECVDCGAKELLEFDHVPSYEESGRTVVDELQLRCSTCHRFRHRRHPPDTMI